MSVDSVRRGPHRQGGDFSFWLCTACLEQMTWQADRRYTCITPTCPQWNIPITLPDLLGGALN